MILSYLIALSLNAQANITVELENEHVEIGQEACVSGGCFKDVSANSTWTRNRIAERQAIANIMNESSGGSVSFSNTSGAAVRED